MQATTLAYAVAGVACVSVAQILFKAASAGFNAPGAGILERWLQPTLVAAVVLYAAATWLWLIALGRGRLIVLYPLMATSYLLVPLLAWWWLGEAPRWQTWAGSALIVAGVAIASR